MKPRQPQYDGKGHFRLCSSLLHNWSSIIALCEKCSRLLHNCPRRKKPVIQIRTIFSSKTNHVLQISFRKPFNFRHLIFQIRSQPRNDARPPPLFNLTIMDHPPDVPIHGYHLCVSGKRRFRLRRADTRLDLSQKRTVLEKASTQRPSPAACSASLSASSSRSVPLARPSVKRQGMPENPV